MGPCVSSNKKNNIYEPSIQLKLVHVSNSSPDENPNSIKKRSSTPSERLA